VLTKIINDNQNEKIQQAIQVQAEVKPASTDIEKQESIVTILSQLLDEIEQDNRIMEYRKIGESTAWERNAIHNALEKLLALDNLKIISIE
jgi:hypothetical protein